MNVFLSDLAFPLFTFTKFVFFSFYGLRSDEVEGFWAFATQGYDD